MTIIYKNDTMSLPKEGRERSMALIKAGIFLKDRIFAEALAEGLSRQAGPIRFYLLSAFEEGDFCDLILAEPDWDRDEGVFGERRPRKLILRNCGTCRAAGRRKSLRKAAVQDLSL